MKYPIRQAVMSFHQCGGNVGRRSQTHDSQSREYLERGMMQYRVCCRDVAWYSHAITRTTINVYILWHVLDSMPRG